MKSLIKSEFSTKTEQIFNLTAPYNNPYQGKGPFLLFVCSAGLLRSPTAAAMAVKLGYNARSCGARNHALIPLSANLIKWSSRIIFMDKECYNKALQDFEQNYCYHDIQLNSTIWDIPDEYEYMNPELVLKVRKLLNKLPENISK